jgi:hypothetical protein
MRSTGGRAWLVVLVVLLGACGTAERSGSEADP